MLDNSLGAAFIDGGIRHRILGKRLRRFSLWHRLLLQAIDSPFLRKGEVHLLDLRNAVGACRLVFPNSRIVRPLCFRPDLRKSVDQFLSYAGDYLTRPEYSIIPPARDSGVPQPRRGQAPESILMVGDIIAWSGWAPERVWNLPIGQSYWYRMLAQRAAGADVDFLTEEEREFQTTMKERSAAADSSCGEPEN